MVAWVDGRMVGLGGLGGGVGAVVLALCATLSDFRMVRR
jgi:hypothetical protein